MAPALEPGKQQAIRSMSTDVYQVQRPRQRSAQFCRGLGGCLQLLALRADSACTIRFGDRGVMAGVPSEPLDKTVVRG